MPLLARAPVDYTDYGELIETSNNVSVKKIPQRSKSQSDVNYSPINSRKKQSVEIKRQLSFNIQGLKLNKFPRLYPERRSPEEIKSILEPG
uniref:Uncharacterized protein n=1 Tax=Trichobilharzia regenti TaxID=157069 RepID=A0AA85J0F9_TRIRE|nr:unnamed protein product [Trichobilharzia regenti]